MVFKNKAISNNNNGCKQKLQLEQMQSAETLARTTADGLQNTFPIIRMQ
jgi:hypothetical protein